MLTKTTVTKTTVTNTIDNKGALSPFYIMKGILKKMAYKLHRYNQKKVASKMKKYELELTVKGLAKSLNDFMEKGRKSDMTEGFTNFLAKSGYQIERKNKKGKKIKGVSVRVSGLTKDELIKKIGAYNKLLNELEKGNKRYENLKKMAERYNVSPRLMQKIFEYMHESAIENYLDSDQIIKTMQMYKGDWENFSKAEFKKLVDDFINKKAKQQQEINLDKMFEELKSEQK